MTEHEYWNAILAINSANLAANVENVQIKERAVGYRLPPFIERAL